MKKIENLKIGKYVLKIDTYTTTVVEYYGEKIEIDLAKGFKKFKNSNDILKFKKYLKNYGVLTWYSINYGDYHINLNQTDQTDLTVNFEIFSNRELCIKYDETKYE